MVFELGGRGALRSRARSAGRASALTGSRPSADSGAASHPLAKSHRMIAPWLRGYALTAGRTVRHRQHGSEPARLGRPTGSRRGPTWHGFDLSGQPTHGAKPWQVHREYQDPEDH